MKPLVSALVAVSLSALFSPCLAAQDPPPNEDQPGGPGGPGPAGKGGPGAAGGQRRGQPHDETPVGREMEEMQGVYRKLNRQYADASKKTSSVELVSMMEKRLDAARSLMPSEAEKLSGEEKAKYLATYHEDLDALAKTFSALREALNAGDNAAAKAQLEKIAELKDSSQKDLGVKNGGRGPGRGGPRGPEGPGGMKGTGGPDSAGARPAGSPI